MASPAVGMVESLGVVVLLVGLRLVVVLLLVAGPWTDEAHELAGWDVARFQQLADTPGRPYRDFDVEYPPGTLAVVELLAGSDVTVTHDRLVVFCLITDLLLAATLARSRGRPAAVTYLAMGTAMLPIVYLRLDLLATLLAGVTLVAAARARPGSRLDDVWVAGLALPTGFSVKLWPVAVLPGLVVAGRWKAAVAAAVGVGVATAAWVAWAGTGSIGQVLGYRGARGWHVESVVGAVVGLATGAPAVMESGSYRLGAAPGWARSALLAAAAGAAALAWLGAGRRSREAAHDPAGADPLPGNALAALTAVAALLVGSALLSPQFLAWMLPFAAICWVTGERMVAGLAAAAMVVTAATLAWFGPPGLANPVAEVLLVLRGGLLVAVVAGGLWRLRPLRGRPKPKPQVPAGATAS